MKMVIGTRKWSSWSMRPWLVARHAGIDFEEVLVTLRETETTDALKDYSPSEQCPVLIDGGLSVWDSLAICEYLADKHPDKALWPADAGARAQGRSACAQMHSSFQSLRGECSVDLSAPLQTMELTPATEADVRKMVRLWRELLERYDGPYLLGYHWSIADAFFIPVATRFRTYGIDLSLYGDDDGSCAAYADRCLKDPDFLDWERLALAEG
jgi:glutathione S-transferase